MVGPTSKIYTLSVNQLQKPMAFFRHHVCDLKKMLEGSPSKEFMLQRLCRRKDDYYGLGFGERRSEMAKYPRTITVILSLCLLMLGGCFSYHSTKETTQPAAIAPPSMQPGESTTDTTTETDDGTTHEHSTTSNNPY